MSNATAAPALGRPTKTTADDNGSRAFVRDLTTYALHAGPERVDQMLRQAYGHLVPGSAARSQALDDDLAGRPRGWPTCDQLRCWRVFRRRSRRHRFCSRRCQRAASKRRERLRPVPVTGDPIAVLADCRAALARLVGEEAA